MARTTVILFTAVVFASGCGGTGGVGEACDTPGATDDECEDGSICDSTDGDTVCLQICEDQADCGEGEACNGVSGSNIKACHGDGDGDDGGKNK